MNLLFFNFENYLNFEWEEMVSFSTLHNFMETVKLGSKQGKFCIISFDFMRTWQRHSYNISYVRRFM